jgi:hypothetical protein
MFDLHERTKIVWSIHRETGISRRPSARSGDATDASETACAFPWV